MRLLICGSRGWKDPAPLQQTIEQYQRVAATSNEDLVVIHGGAKGVDLIADRIARDLGIPVIREDAEWRRYGKGAGPIRNQKMLTLHNPDLVIAFRAGGKSDGTDDMIRRTHEAGITCTVIDDKEINA